MSDAATGRGERCAKCGMGDSEHEPMSPNDHAFTPAPAEREFVEIDGQKVRVAVTREQAALDQALYGVVAFRCHHPEPLPPAPKVTDAAGGRMSEGTFDREAGGLASFYAGAGRLLAFIAEARRARESERVLTLEKKAALGSEECLRAELAALRESEGKLREALTEIVDRCDGPAYRIAREALK